MSLGCVHLNLSWSNYKSVFFFSICLPLPRMGTSRWQRKPLVSLFLDPWCLDYFYFLNECMHIWITKWVIRWICAWKNVFLNIQKDVRQHVHWYRLENHSVCQYSGPFRAHILGFRIILQEQPVGWFSYRKSCGLPEAHSEWSLGGDAEAEIHRVMMLLGF